MRNFYIILGMYMPMHSVKVFGAEKGMPQLNPEFWAAQVFWLILIFIVLYLIVSKVFLPKITYSVENRKSKVVNDLHEAQKLKEQAEKKLEEYNQIIDETKKEAKKIIAESNKSLESDIKNKKQKLDEQIDQEIKTVEKEIKDLKKTSIESISKIASEISGEMIKLIIDSEVNKSSVSAIVDNITKKEMDKNI